MCKWFKTLFKIDVMNEDLDILAADVVYLEGEIENLVGRVAALEAKLFSSEEGTQVDQVQPRELHDSEPKVDPGIPTPQS